MDLVQHIALLKTLTELGYLRFSDRTRRYSLTFKILNLGFSAISRMEIREIIRPELLSLAEITKQVVSFRILDNVDVVYIDRVQSNAFRLGVDISGTEFLHITQRLVKVF